MVVLAVVAISVSMLAVSCGNKSKAADDPVVKPDCKTPAGATEGLDVDAASRPGVTDKAITVGGVAGKTNPIGRPYEAGFDGVNAYFEMINCEEGGVFGRELKLGPTKDDQSAASQNVSAVRSLVEEDKVFAVLPMVTQVFQGAKYLDENNIPTFGWNINKEFATGDNLYGDRGSFIDFTRADPYLPYLATKLGKTKVGIQAYTASQSSECAKGQKNSFEKYGLEVVYYDANLGFGFTDITAEIAKMEDAGVEFLATCMDLNGVASISAALAIEGLEVSIYAPEGYDPSGVAAFKGDLDGIYFSTAFVPFEVPEAAEGMADFLKWMKIIGKTPNEQALAGWVGADLMVAGILAAGPEFTRDSLIEAINKMENFTAHGAVPGTDWTVQHSASGDVNCVAYVLVEDGKYVPKFGEEGKPFSCFVGPKGVPEKLPKEASHTPGGPA